MCKSDWAKIDLASGWACVSLKLNTPTFVCRSRRPPGHGQRFPHLSATAIPEYSPTVESRKRWSAAIAKHARAGLVGFHWNQSSVDAFPDACIVQCSFSPSRFLSFNAVGNPPPCPVYFRSRRVSGILNPGMLKQNGKHARMGLAGGLAMEWRQSSHNEERRGVDHLQSSGRRPLLFNGASETFPGGFMIHPFKAPDLSLYSSPYSRQSRKHMDIFLGMRDGVQRDPY